LPGAEAVGELPWRLPSLTVVAVDPSGRPVPSASVRFLDEQDRHRVNAETGSWTGSVRYLPDGSERAFQRGDTLQVEVFAPGYGYTRDAYTLERRRRHQLEVVLRPLELEAPAVPSVGPLAVESWRRWCDAEARMLELRTEDSWREADHARAETARLAREWMDLGGGEDARELCLMTGSLALCGG
jgi:hypothetical protein